MTRSAELDRYISGDFLKLVSEDGKGRATWERGVEWKGQAGGREEECWNQTCCCQFQQRPKNQAFTNQALLDFSVRGSCHHCAPENLKHFGVFFPNKTLVNNKWTLQRPIEHLGTTLDSESHSSENWPNEYRGRSQQRGPERESGFILDHTKKYAVFPYARWAQIRFNIVFSHWYPP